MAILTLRSTKGGPLTNLELDNNFANLNGELTVNTSNIGNVNLLATAVKSNLVFAVNETVSYIGPLLSLATSTTSNVVYSINEVLNNVGRVTDLATGIKTNTVFAINEVFSNVGLLNNLVTIEKSNIVAAINEVRSAANILSGNISGTIITNSTWSGNTITVSRGGTGNTIFASGNLLMGNGTGAIQSATPGTDYARPNVISTWSAAQTFTAALIETPSVANTGSSYTLNDRSFHDLTLTSSPVSLTFPTAVAGKQFTLFIKQDGSGSRTINWPGTVRWPGGTQPALTSTASRTDVISFVCDGTYWLGFVGGANFTR